MNPTILVVDDEENIRRSLTLTLEGAGFEVATAATGEAALELVRADPPAAVFLDVMLPGIDGIEVLRGIRSSAPSARVIMISGHATVERAVEAIRLGAFEFVEKPFGRDRILVLARNAVDAARLEREVERLRATESSALLGESAVIARLRSEIESVAPTNARVLIRGESGTGKELVAAALHTGSPRADRPYVRVNCAAIPDDLIEAELFGSSKGAFTGAIRDRTGRLLAADGGTLFLDEIGDMSLQAQAKVLRVLQEGEYEPVGSSETIRVDIRVIAATHKDLRAAVTAGEFREDLLFRLDVIPIVVPPLREREGDIRLLGEHFLRVYAARHEMTPPVLTDAAWAHLGAYPWPGNVRELKNLTERWVILRSGRQLDVGDLGIEVTRPTVGAVRALSAPDDAGSASAGSAAAAVALSAADDAVLPARYAQLSLRDAREAFERDLILAALATARGNVTRAAAQLGLERTHLHKRIRALGIKE